MNVLIIHCQTLKLLHDLIHMYIAVDFIFVGFYQDCIYIYIYIYNIYYIYTYICIQKLFSYDYVSN